MRCHREIGNRHDQYAVLIKQNDGAEVGRVPREVSKVISQGLLLGHIVDAMVIYTGQMRHDGPVRGGGPKLCAAYLLKLRNVPSVMHVASELKEKLNENDMFM